MLTNDGGDNGVDFFINEGIKYLDKLVKTTKSYASRMSILSAGDFYAQFPQCRSVKEVWAATTEGRWQLEKISVQDMIVQYMSSPPAERENGTPLYYSLAVSRYIPEDISAAELTTFSTFVQTLDITGYDYNIVLLSAPVDQDTLIDVRGLFYSAELVENTDTNFWSVNYPLLLVLAAHRQVHMSGGNKVMMDRVDESIIAETTRIEMDLVEEQIAEADQMEG